MRRVLGVSTVVVLLVALTAGAAYAIDNAVIQCTGVPCVVTGNNDKIYERRGNGLRDQIQMRGGDDLVIANTYTRDADRVFGGRGYDKIYVNDGDRLDFANAGTGRGGNICYVDSRDEAGPGCTQTIVRPPR